MKTEKYVVFALGSQNFGIPVHDVTDVLHNPTCTKVPLSSADIIGILNMRGYIVTVLDMRVRLSITEPKPEQDIDTPMCLVVSFKGVRYGLMVDYVHEVIDLPVNEYAPVPASLDSAVRQIARGVYQYQKTLMLTLDITKIFGQPQSTVASAVA